MKKVIKKVLLSKKSRNASALASLAVAVSVVNAPWD